MDAKKTDFKARHDRYPYKEPVKITTETGDTYHAHSRDVSRSGMALSLQGPVVDNGQFLELHSEALGELSGRVTRSYSGGAALQFEKHLLDDPDPSKLISKLNKLA